MHAVTSQLKANSNTALLPTSTCSRRSGRRRWVLLQRPAAHLPARRFARTDTMVLEDQAGSPGGSLDQRNDMKMCLKSSQRNLHLLYHHYLSFLLTPRLSNKSKSHTFWAFVPLFSFPSFCLSHSIFISHSLHFSVVSSTY